MMTVTERQDTERQDTDCVDCGAEAAGSFHWDGCALSTAAMINSPDEAVRHLKPLPHPPDRSAVKRAKVDVDRAGRVLLAQIRAGNLIAVTLAEALQIEAGTLAAIDPPVPTPPRVPRWRRAFLHRLVEAWPLLLVAALLVALTWEVSR